MAIFYDARVAPLTAIIGAAVARGRRDGFGVTGHSGAGMASLLAFQISPLPAWRCRRDCGKYNALNIFCGHFLMKALVVDPSKLYQLMLDRTFQEYGSETEVLATGEEALQAAQQQDFDIVCAALHLPDMSGIELCRQLRSRAARSHIPIILLTSSDDKTTQTEGLKAGVTEIFNKSEMQDLGEYIRDFFDHISAARHMSGRVLLIEDSPSVSAILKAYFCEIGLEVDHFPSAEQALAAFENHEYELVVTDVLLEGAMSGTGLVRHIRRAKDKKRRVPILAMSGMDDASRKIELLRSGANDFISKPILQEELLARAKNLITNKQLLDKVEAQHEHLKLLAMTDQLTSLYNRHFLTEVAVKSISEACRHGHPLSMILIDLDHFKVVNDTHGHGVGDIVLTETAMVIKSACRREDIPGRLGGEEFIVVLPHCTLDSAQEKAERLRQDIEALNPHGIAVTASFGVASLPGEKMCGYEQLFLAADKAVYAAKEGGRNRVVVAAA